MGLLYWRGCTKRWNLLTKIAANQELTKKSFETGLIVGGNHLNSEKTKDELNQMSTNGLKMRLDSAWIRQETPNDDSNLWIVGHRVVSKGTQRHKKKTSCPDGVELVVQLGVQLGGLKSPSALVSFEFVLSWRYIITTRETGYGWAARPTVFVWIAYCDVWLFSLISTRNFASRPSPQAT